jgi:hypothetical protein
MGKIIEEKGINEHNKLFEIGIAHAEKFCAPKYVGILSYKQVCYAVWEQHAHRRGGQYTTYTKIQMDQHSTGTYVYNI